jgi:hypothetical protein
MMSDDRLGVAPEADLLISGTGTRVDGHRGAGAGTESKED